jgi:hypothetical protein
MIPETAIFKDGKTGVNSSLKRSDKSLTQSRLQEFSSVEVKNNLVKFTFSNGDIITFEGIWDVKSADIQ